MICISWIYPHFVDIIYIGHITSYLARNFCHVLYSSVLVVDIIYISPITSYLARNIRPIFHIYSYSESDWRIFYFPVCNLICFYVLSSYCFVHFVSDYKMKTNTIRIYVPPFITSIKSGYYFRLIFRFACCIGMLYTGVVWSSCCNVSLNNEITLEIKNIDVTQATTAKLISCKK